MIQSALDIYIRPFTELWEYQISSVLFFTQFFVSLVVLVRVWLQGLYVRTQQKVDFLWQIHLLNCHIETSQTTLVISWEKWADLGLTIHSTTYQGEGKAPPTPFMFPSISFFRLFSHEKTSSPPCHHQKWFCLPRTGCLCELLGSGW